MLVSNIILKSGSNTSGSIKFFNDRDFIGFGSIDTKNSLEAKLYKSGSTDLDLIFITSSGTNPRLGVGTKDPKSTFDFKDVEDSSKGVELILRTSRTTKGAETGDDGGVINFVIDSGSFGDITTSGSLAKIKTTVNEVGDGGAQGILTFTLSKGAGAEGHDIVKYGYTIGGEGTFAQIQTGSLIIKDFGALAPSKIKMVDYDGTTNLQILEGNITASGNITSSDVYINDWGSVSASLASAGSGGGGSADNLGNHTATQDLNLANFDITNVTTASVDRLNVNDKLQGNGSGFQFFSFNEDTSKVKFVNWYGSQDNQYGMGMLWYETWFAAIDTDGNANDTHRRIGFYLEQPEAGATDSTSGETGRHPNNARFYVDITGSYVASGGLHVTDADFNVESNGSVTSQGYNIISQSGNFTNNEFIVAVGANAITSSDALAVDSAGNLGIGTSTPDVRLHMLGEAPQTTQILMEQYNDTADAPDIRTRRFRGTPSAPADVQTGDYLFRLNVEGRDGGANTGYGSMQFDVDSNDQDALNFKLTTRDTNGDSGIRYKINGSGNHEFTGSLDVSGQFSATIDGGTF